MNARTSRSREGGLARVGAALVGSPGLLLLLLTATCVLLAALNILLGSLVPIVSMILVLMVGGFWLRLRPLALLSLVVLGAVFFASSTRQVPLSPGTWATLLVAALLLMLFARSRERLGLQGIAGDTMLIDLRDRLRAHGEIPPLPRGWHVETELRPAYGDSFSGDFLVSSVSRDRRVLRLALVDVSGKGQGAGTRALLLSGAFGGLIGALPAAQFLPAANNYLLRQHWDEGFATAMHIAVDLTTGHYRVASAGHPPAAQFHRGSGRWQVLRSEHGPALGILDGVDYPAYEGVLEPGDAFIMYTDGLIEAPGRDLDFGIDRLMGQAELLVSQGFRVGGAARVLDGTAAAENDDRALVLIWRQ